MFSAKSLKASLLIAAIGIGAGSALLAPAEANAGASKTVSCGKLKNAKVKAECTKLKGDFKAMKKFMKATTKGKYKCKDCHSDTKTYKDATAETQKKLAALLK